MSATHWQQSVTDGKQSVAHWKPSVTDGFMSVIEWEQSMNQLPKVPPAVRSPPGKKTHVRLEDLFHELKESAPTVK
jgi:hypothetical protein